MGHRDPIIASPRSDSDDGRFTAAEASETIQRAGIWMVLLYDQTHGWPHRVLAADPPTCTWSRRIGTTPQDKLKQKTWTLTPDELTNGAQAAWTREPTAKRAKKAYGKLKLTTLGGVIGMCAFSKKFATRRRECIINPRLNGLSHVDWWSRNPTLWRLG